ncbi:hypothetical protein G7Y89_g653 [Cudoniella acicularis]|uniref:Uncharacterized protein n=1 Tax=Cudoniella acicularis TaxID=354080 RepID=A0A8H4RZK8_9HELO|nr:hypothetical protein G7Y89_g653 [Cudoniella acicularis]
MERDGRFADYDDAKVYEDSKRFSLDPSTSNFVVEFGFDSAQIAFNLDENGFKDLLGSARTDERPVRWINIWAPHRQKGIVQFLTEHYEFSPRLSAIIATDPEADEGISPAPARHHLTQRIFPHNKDDVELGAVSMDVPRTSLHNDTSHYAIVKQMYQFHSIDVGQKFICIAANWMHEQEQKSSKSDRDFNIEEEGQQRRLYSWLVLCNDNTVISFHEHPGSVGIEDLKSIRSNLLSVLYQISKNGYDPAEVISMQSVRQVLNKSPVDKWGEEGASNLFYYLFDDWRAVYSTVGAFQKRLTLLQKQIFHNMTRKSVESIDIEIIPKLHVLGTQIRRMHHVYEGYKNLVQRILEPPKPSVPDDSRQDPVLADSARSRFERLGDRLQLMILSETKEFLTEKDALISTYFNINAQKDTESTSRLTRAATLLAKLSVLFLPVNLMTAYFSMQITAVRPA